MDFVKDIKGELKENRNKKWQSYMISAGYFGAGLQAQITKRLPVTAISGHWFPNILNPKFCDFRQHLFQSVTTILTNTKHDSDFLYASCRALFRCIFWPVMMASLDKFMKIVSKSLTQETNVHNLVKSTTLLFKERETLPNLPFPSKYTLSLHREYGKIHQLNATKALVTSIINLVINQAKSHNNQRNRIVTAHGSVDL